MANPKWNYDERAGTGPSHWPKFFEDGNGVQQSPIDILTDKTTHDPNLKPVSVSYPTFNKASLTHNGLSFVFTPEDENNSVLQGGPLSDKYQLAQFHFHWGDKSNTGSEHRVNGKMYEAELHLVHWNTVKYKDVGTALTSKQGLSVLGIFLEEDATAKDHEGLKAVTDLLPSLTEKGKKVMLPKPFNPSVLLPGINPHWPYPGSFTIPLSCYADSSKYWTYPGSLTTPPLSESVTWIVFKEPIKVSPAQMQAFRGLKNTEGKPMAGNFRPPCPLHGRTVRASFP